ncbi:MAG: PDDEXK nuclease domain-containing protein [bacterium]|nr:PDDEXK nuclease domain-containing protein [bacterium]
MHSEKMTFDSLVSSIRQVHEYLAAQAGKAVNISLTLRNWAIGCYIREYEQNGADRAQYGENLLEDLAASLRNKGMKRVAARELRRYRQFYLTYQQIWQSVTTEFCNLLPPELLQLPAPIRESPTPILQIPGKTLITKLSFTHLAELIAIDNPLKRTFYEVECIRGNWSIRELKRQIGSLYYERSGLSENKDKLAELAQSGAEQAEPKLAIRDPYIFEFLGVKSSEVMGESDLEDALLDKLQDFLLEMGHGFCFEARQKRILIGNTHGFVDLVFYHRILKCHVLVELKVESFTHENLGQLNTYVSWYRKNMMADNDNPPVGILLCTQKDHALVEYALAGLDNALFVSKYQLELPKKEDIQRFLEEKIREVGNG